jgi:cysteine desulfurase
MVVNGDLEKRLPGNLSLSFRNIDSLSLQENLKNVAISLGSACTSSSTGISHVIQAIHGKEITPIVTIRVSIGRFTSKKDIETAASELISFIKTEKGKKNDVLQK